MPDISTGTITYIDAESNFSTLRVKVNATKTKADVETLATALAPFSACGQSAHGVVDKTHDGGAGAGNKDVKGVFTCMDEYRSVHKWEIPGYSGASEQDKDGEHMIDPDLSTIRAAFEAYTGYSLTQLRSPVIQTR